METADMVLMGDDLAKLPFAVRLGRSTMSVIKQNITFAIGIKLLAVLAVFPGWLTLWLAILADMGATILVTLNSLRLLSIKQEQVGQEHSHQGTIMILVVEDTSQIPPPAAEDNFHNPFGFKNVIPYHFEIE
ncbi:hypothetical protein N752_12800 [Desulforamulus aquiferis]|nr:hypothetical protein N752_12800 [Desulforamulus aquiferis]